MRKWALVIGTCVMALCGCASNGLPHLSYHQSMVLLTAVNGWATEGGPRPEPVEKLHPLQVYNDHGNCVIVLQRDAHGEQGYYIIPSTSSFDPRFRQDPGWTLKPMDYFDPNLQYMYEYSRKY